mmetsp:Transcript_17064/g.31391  ORF Transcript_17064/g.31391 Transcript_17064/m.31391 type:complete len:95 (-) Transcript_17064:34-318(-)
MLRELQCGHCQNLKGFRTFKPCHILLLLPRRMSSKSLVPGKHVNQMLPASRDTQKLFQDLPANPRLSQDSQKLIRDDSGRSGYDLEECTLHAHS